jgi:DNA-binding transcriptional ArsR family regulator
MLTYCGLLRSRTRKSAGQGDVFYAIADPTRRRLLDLLAHSERPVNYLAERFSISRPAVSQHLRILRNTGLVTVRQNGREQRYRLRALQLRKVHEWVAEYQQFWSEKLLTLGEHLRRDP